MTPLFNAIVLGASLAAVGDPAATPLPIEGNWYTEGAEAGIYAQFIIHNLSNGSFLKNIIVYPDCQVPYAYTEAGIWTVEGSTYREVTIMVGRHVIKRGDPHIRDSFDIITIDDHHFAMRDVKTNITWQMERVPETARMPAPHLPPPHCGEPK